MQNIHYMINADITVVSEGDCVKVFANDGNLCPICNGVLIRWGFENRKIKTGGEIIRIISQRLYCKHCHSAFHIYSDDLALPSIQYSPAYYNKVVSEGAICPDCEACDSTQNRWSQKTRMQRKMNMEIKE